MNDDLGKSLAMLALMALFYYAGWSASGHMLTTSKAYLSNHLIKLEEGDIRAFYDNLDDLKIDLIKPGEGG